MNTILCLLTKLLTFKILGMIFLLIIGIYSEELVDFCDMNNFKPPKNVSHCGNLKLIQLNMTYAEKELIVETINKLKNRIAEGKMNLQVLGHSKYLLPQAAGMTEIKWDDTLAEAASRKILECNFGSDVRKFGGIGALSMHPKISNRSNANLKEALQRNFFDNAKYFNISLLTDYERSTSYFTIFAHQSLLFVGCAMAEPPWKELQFVCYFAPWEKVTHNMLYKQGTPLSDCPFSHSGFNRSSTNYTSLCIKPDWPICDHQMQKNANNLKGLGTTSTSVKTTTTSTTTSISEHGSRFQNPTSTSVKTTSNTTSISEGGSRFPKLVNSWYISIIVLIVF